MSPCAPRLIRAGMALLALCVGGCGGGGDGGTGPLVQNSPPVYLASAGLAQKGPLISGSTVTVQELSANLAPTGRQFSYQILSDLGAFAPTGNFAEPHVGVIATGYYFDEVTNAVSSGPVTLNAYADLGSDTALNVNVLTTLAYQRVQRLVTNSGLTFAAARAQAEGEVLAAFNMAAASTGNFGSLSLAGSRDGDRMLAAVSALLVYGNAAGPLSQLIAGIQADIGNNGRITNVTTQAALQAAARGLNPATVAANLAQKYGAAGAGITATGIADWLDRDNDGVVGRYEYSVANATPGTAFTIPAVLVTQYSGTSWSVSAGRLAINGATVSGAATVRAGDVVTVTPASGAFPSGVLTLYVSSGSTRIARVSFVSGLLSLAITPANPGMAKGASRQFTATGTFSDTSIADLSTQVTWSSSLPSVATVSSTGMAKGLAVGTSIITATSGTVTTTTTLSVSTAVIANLAITPNPAITGIGIAASLKATAVYTDATTANVTDSVVWSVTTPAVAAISSIGVLTGVTLGTTTVSASLGAISGAIQGNVVANAWTLASPMSAPRSGHTATLLPNGKVLVAGGSGRISTEIYDPSRDTWSVGAPLAEGRTGHSAFLLGTGKVMVMGGGTTPGSAEFYDPVGDRWSAAPGWTIVRSMSNTIQLADGRVLVVGDNASGQLSAEIYNPATNTWSAAASPAVRRSGASVTLLANGKVLRAGGNAGNIGSTSRTAEIYDPASNTWTAVASMNVERAVHAAVLLGNGKVLVTGGYSNNNGSIASFIGTTEIYDPVGNSWTQMASSYAGWQAQAIALPNGKGLVTGGSWSSGRLFDTSHRADVFNPATNSWEAADDMPFAHADHSMTLLPNGTVLVTGSDLTAELFFPAP